MFRQLQDETFILQQGKVQPENTGRKFFGLLAGRMPSWQYDIQIIFIKRLIVKDELLFFCIGNDEIQLAMEQSLIGRFGRQFVGQDFHLGIFFHKLMEDWRQEPGSPAQMDTKFNFSRDAFEQVSHACLIVFF